MIYRIASRWLACMALLLPLAAAAEEHGLTLGAAIDRSLSGNSSLAAQAADAEATSARAERDALLPPFTVGVELENFAGSGSLQGLDSSEATLRVGKLIELGGKRSARTALGDAEVARQQNLTVMARLETATQTRLRFIEVLADQQRLEVAREHVQLAQRARDEVSVVVRNARNPETDLHSAELSLADAELELEHAEHELAAAKVALASTWGARTPDFQKAQGSLTQLPDAETLEALAARLDGTPTRRDALLQAEVLTARRRLAQAASLPDLTATLGVRHLEGLGDQALVMSVSLPLGARSRAALELREADALSSVREHQTTAARSDVYRLLFEKYQELMHARSEFELLQQRMLPAASSSHALAQRGFEAGRFAYATLAQTQERLVELRRRQIDSSARYLTLLAEIDLLAAKPLGVAP
jgi:cobalt-zinc-cadmium efflux system outer membrane protein